MKRDDEELCKARFDVYLLTLFERGEVIWIPVEKRCEPPDFYLELAGVKYAVEVTSLIEKMHTRTGNEISFLSTLFPLKELVESVSVRAKQGGCLNGGYKVVFKEPFEDLARIKGRLERDLLDYIKKTKNENTSPELMVHKQGDQICTITKVHNQAGEVQMIWNRGAINVDGLEADICRLVKERLDEKEYRLRNIRIPKIILLHDLYGFGEYTLNNPVFRTGCAELLTDPLKSFKAVFVVRDDSKGFVLYPEESQWKRTLFIKEPAYRLTSVSRGKEESD
jgi:hypothetical protein